VVFDRYIMNNDTPRLYLDYTLASRLDNEMGRGRFINFLERHLVITVDKDCYDFIISIQNKAKKNKKRNE
jgi:hypothetical protein